MGHGPRSRGSGTTKNARDGFSGAARGIRWTSDERVIWRECTIYERMRDTVHVQQYILMKEKKAKVTNVMRRWVLHHVSPLPEISWKRKRRIECYKSWVHRNAQGGGCQTCAKTFTKNCHSRFTNRQASISLASCNKGGNSELSARSRTL